eukprot:1148270-Pelagomonas_calceolata.AAC.1
MNSMASVYAKDNWDLGAAGGVEDAAAFDVQISGWKAKDGWDYGSLREKTSSLATLLPKRVTYHNLQLYLPMRAAELKHKGYKGKKASVKTFDC